MESKDFLIIGSGIAGLSFALKAATIGKVLLVTKSLASDSNTKYAQGGIACVLGDDDNPDIHIKDTLEAGAGLCNETAVKVMVNEAVGCIKDLLALGVPFSLASSQLDLGLEGGHSKNRIVHVKDYTGREIENVLVSSVKNHPNIKLLENHLAIDLIVEEDENEPGLNRECIGATVLNQASGDITSFYAQNTIICTGGAGQVYLHTTNPEIATGDGVAMASRAGVKISDMEFVQFHPTAFYSNVGPVFLISEALRGAGAILRNESGEAFMSRYHPLASLAPRDIACRAIETEMKLSGTEHVYLDATVIPAKKLKTLFPHIYETCLMAGIDITKDKIPVGPSAHFMCGGIVTDLDGKTSLENLFAFGEAACTGVHGANRLASNSLLEALVFSNRAFQYIRKKASIKKGIFKPFENAASKSISDNSTIPDADRLINLRDEIKHITEHFCGITRYRDELRLALVKIEELEKEISKLFSLNKNYRMVVELYNLVIIARLIITGAINRKESIGAHFIFETKENQGIQEIIEAIAH